MREGWREATLGELVEKRKDFTPVVGDVLYDIVGVQRSGWGLVHREPVRGDSMQFKKLMQLEEGNLVYRTITAFEAPSAVVRAEDVGTFVTPQVFPTFRLDESLIVTGFMALLTSSPTFHEAMSVRCTGSVLRRKTLSVSAFESIPILLPSPAEQRRIVDLIGALDEAIEAAVGQSEAIEASSRSIRARIFSELTTTHPRTTADDTFAIVLGRQKSEAQLDGDHVIPYVRAANIGKGKLMLNDIQRMNFTPAEQNKFNLEIGDVLVVEGGSIGQTAVWDGAIEGPVGFDKHVLRLRGVEELSTSRYAFQWARWCYESGQFESTATGITIKALGRARIGAMGVPEVALSEQDEIASVLEEIDGAANEARAYNDSLRNLRTNLLTVLLSGEHEIPESYDELLVAA